MLLQIAVFYVIMAAIIFIILSFAKSFGDEGFNLIEKMVFSISWFVICILLVINWLMGKFKQ